MYTTLYTAEGLVFLVLSTERISADKQESLSWLLSAEHSCESSLKGLFVGPRREMVSPWSTNACEIALNSGIEGVERLERFRVAQGEPSFDPMLEQVYEELGSETLLILGEPEPLLNVTDIAAFNDEFGLALSGEEVVYLKEAAEKFGRPLTDAEVFSFAQINSEHCRHKIFNGIFVIDGVEREKSLFDMIKETSKESPQEIVSAYNDNVALFSRTDFFQFAPRDARCASLFEVKERKAVLSIKAETHNFPTTVEPFYGASTGSGGEIRDRMAGGRGSIPLVGSAVYMTSYPRFEEEDGKRVWESSRAPRQWKYQSPQEILIKASNGASDFGNKFGQPLILGSLLTFEGDTSHGLYAYDRVVMLAGGLGYAIAGQAIKAEPEPGDEIVVLGGDNYRIGLAGGSVSSVDTGELSRTIELSAVQRANPEMQKRVYNAIRALVESEENNCKSIHDHGAGGHINCLAELIEPQGGTIDNSKLPIGDPTLSPRELISNESQERMGLLLPSGGSQALEKICRRERAPIYVVGDVSGDGKLLFQGRKNERVVDFPLETLFGSTPKTVLKDQSPNEVTSNLEWNIKSGADLLQAVRDVFLLEGVACKDWLTNKVDRSVGGRSLIQQTVGALQFPLNNLGLAALDFEASCAIAKSLGQAPIAGLLKSEAGSILSVARALTNIVWAPLEKGLDSVVLSANWMWPAKQSGEDARLYRAVEALSQFAIKLGIPVPTGKDSLSMTMKYADGQTVWAPGTVVVSAAALSDAPKYSVTPRARVSEGNALIYLDFSSQDNNPLGGSAFSQMLGEMGAEVASVEDPAIFRKAFNTLQQAIRDELIISGHDISSGGLITSVCEMCFAGDIGVLLELESLGDELVPFLFSEKPGVLLQVAGESLEEISSRFHGAGVKTHLLGSFQGSEIQLSGASLSFSASVEDLCRAWFRTSFLFDKRQCLPEKAFEREQTLFERKLDFRFPSSFTGKMKDYGIDLRGRNSSGIRAAIIREKGINGDREMAFSLFMAGFDVKDITMFDIINGDENLEDLSFIVFPGGFSNSDVLGAARGWAAAFRYSKSATKSLKRFYQRDNTLSLGVCNGCQLMGLLGLIYPEHDEHPYLIDNESRKFESSFLSVDIQESNSVLLRGLEGSRLGVWVAHGEGKFSFPLEADNYSIPIKYSSSKYPANPNGSDFNAAAIASRNGRHLAMMPHLERSVLSWQWPYYPDQNHKHEISPWSQAFTNAREWIISNP